MHLESEEKSGHSFINNDKDLEMSGRKIVNRIKIAFFIFILNHSQVGSISCLDKVVKKFEEKQILVYKEVAFWSDGCAS